MFSLLLWKFQVKAKEDFERGETSLRVTTTLEMTFEDLWRFQLERISSKPQLTCIWRNYGSIQQFHSAFFQSDGWSLLYFGDGYTLTLLLFIVGLASYIRETHSSVAIGDDTLFEECTEHFNWPIDVPYILFQRSLWNKSPFCTLPRAASCETWLNLHNYKTTREGDIPRLQPLSLMLTSTTDVSWGLQ